MRKKVNLGLLIMATGLFLLAAVFIIAACGPGEEADVTFTVTFDSDGGSPTPAAQSGIAKDGLATQPTETITKDGGYPPSKAGFFKLGTAAPEFKGWLLNGEPYNFTEPVTANITLKAKWEGGEPEEVNNSAGNAPLIAADTAKKLSTVISWLKTSGTTTDKYYLLLNGNVPDEDQPIEMTKGNLTINSINNAGNIGIAQRTIKSALPTSITDKVFLTITGGTTTPITNPPKLTLNCIVLEGRGTGIGNSLVRILNGAELVLENNTGIIKHENNVGGSDAATGNGSAVCISSTSVTSSSAGNIDGGILTLYNGAVIGGLDAANGNKSTFANQANRNLVGGVFGMKGKINLFGGTIINNTSLENQTADVYITEWADLMISGNVSIGELTLNADNNAGTEEAAKIQIPGPVTNTIKKLCLRSTEGTATGSGGTVTTNDVTTALTAIKNRWTGNVILEGIKIGNAATAYTITSNDIGKFNLSDFRGKIPLTNAAISPLKIGSDGTLGN